MTETVSEPLLEAIASEPSALKIMFHGLLPIRIAGAKTANVFGSKTVTVPSLTFVTKTWLPCGLTAMPREASPVGTVPATFFLDVNRRDGITHKVSDESAFPVWQ